MRQDENYTHLYMYIIADHFIYDLDIYVNIINLGL